MYINPFVAGVIATVLVELVAFFAYIVISNIRK